MEDRKKSWAYLFLLALTLTVLPHVIRASSGNNALPGYQPYYHMRIAENIMNGDFSTEDASIYGGRQVFITPYHMLLAGFAFIFGLGLGSVVLPILLGFLSLLLFYKILKHFKIENNSIFLMCVVLVFSPQFIYTFSLSTTNAGAIFFMLLGFYFFLREKRSDLVLSLLCFVLLSLFGLLNALIALFLMLAYSIAEEKKQKWFLLTLFATLLLYSFYPVGFYNSFDPTQNLSFFRDALSDFGGLFGFGIFNLVLFIMGFFFSWHRKKQQYPLYIVMLFLLASAFIYGGSVYLYLNFVASCFAGYALCKLIRLEWSSAVIRNLTILLIICGLLFSSVSYINRTSSMSPDDSIIDALQWMRSHTDKDKIVLSHPTRGFWIQGIAKRPVVLDTFSKETGSYKERLTDSQLIFSSMYLDDTKEVLDKYNITYIFIDPEMASGLVWKEQNGLLFLLQDNETFKNIYSQDRVEVWEVIRTRRK